MKNSQLIALSAAPVAFASAALGTYRYLKGRSDKEVQVVKVKLSEKGLGFKKVKVRRGKAKFEVENEGEYRHAFELVGQNGNGEFNIALPALDPGEKSIFTLELPEGEYEAYCLIDNHRSASRKGRIVFAGA